MPEEQIFKTEEPKTRTEIARALREAADAIEGGQVELQSGDQEASVPVPDTSTFEVELERRTDPDSGERRYELEYELSWTR